MSNCHSFLASEACELLRDQKSNVQVPFWPQAGVVSQQTHVQLFCQMLVRSQTVFYMKRLFLLSVMYTADPQLPLLYYLTNNCKMGLLTIHRGKSVGPWFMQMIRKTSRMGNSLRVQHVHLCNSLKFTQSLELVWLLAQDLELVEKRKWNTTFRLEILSGNFGLPSKKIPFLRKFFYLGDGN